MLQSVIVVVYGYLILVMRSFARKLYMPADVTHYRESIRIMTTGSRRLYEQYWSPRLVRDRDQARRTCCPVSGVTMQLASTYEYLQTHQRDEGTHLTLLATKLQSNPQTLSTNPWPSLLTGTLYTLPTILSHCFSKRSLPNC